MSDNKVRYIRRYSPAEIIELRQALISLQPVGESFAQGEWAKTVEERLRTYLAAECEPAEVIAAERRAWAERTGAVAGHYVWYPDHVPTETPPPPQTFEP